jgi:hypothetical protein
MSEERIEEVVATRLMAFGVDECELVSITPDSKGFFDVRFELHPIVGKRLGTIATQANALALQAISALNTATEKDIDCGMSSCTLEPLSGTSERPVLPLVAKFGLTAT